MRYVRYASNIWNAKYAHTSIDRSHTVISGPCMSLSPAKERLSEYGLVMYDSADRLVLITELCCDIWQTSLHGIVSFGTLHLISCVAMQNLDNQIWKSRISLSTKLKLYNTCILPIFLYSSELAREMNLRLMLSVWPHCTNAR